MPQSICLPRLALLAVSFHSLFFTPSNNSVFAVGRPPPTASCFRSDPCSPPANLLRGRMQHAPAQLGHTLDDVKEPFSSFSSSSPFDDRAERGDRVHTPLELVPHLASALQLQLINANSSSSNSSESSSEAVRKRTAIAGSQASNSSPTDTNNVNKESLPKTLAFCVRDDGSVEQDESALTIRVGKELPAAMINANEDEHEHDAHRTEKARPSLVATIAAHAQRCFVLIQSTYAMTE